MNLITLTTPRSARGGQERVLNMDRLIGMTRVNESSDSPYPYTSVLLSTGGGGAASSYGYTEFRVQETPTVIKDLAEANAEANA